MTRNRAPQTAAPSSNPGAATAARGCCPPSRLLAATPEGSDTVIAEAAIAAALLAGTTSPAQAAAELPHAQAKFRACVAERESGGSYTARNREAGSSAQGAFQFIDGDWRRGLSYMVAKRIRQHGGEHTVTLRARLARTPIRKWEPIYQNVAFAAALNARGPWSGWRHWHYPGSACNSLVPRWAR